MKSAAVNADEAVKNGEFCIKNEELRIKKESFCIKNETRIGSASPSEKWTLQSCCDRTAKKPDKIDVRFENERRFFNRNQDADDRKSLFLPRKIMIWGDQAIAAGVGVVLSGRSPSKVHMAAGMRSCNINGHLLGEFPLKMQR